MSFTRTKTGPLHEEYRYLADDLDGGDSYTIVTQIAWPQSTGISQANFLEDVYVHWYPDPGWSGVPLFSVAAPTVGNGFVNVVVRNTAAPGNKGGGLIVIEAVSSGVQ